jgi:hypothetical protein
MTTLVAVHCGPGEISALSIDRIHLTGPDLMSGRAKLARQEAQPSQNTP